MTDEIYEPSELVLTVPIKCATLNRIGKTFGNVIGHTVVGVFLACYTFVAGFFIAIPVFAVEFVLRNPSFTTVTDRTGLPVYPLVIVMAFCGWLLAYILLTEMLEHYNVSIRIDCIREKPS